jgi:hypothetical protein
MKNFYTLPTPIKVALLRWANSGQKLLSGPLSEAVIDGAESLDRKAWFVSILCDDGSTQVFKVA